MGKKLIIAGADFSQVAVASNSVPVTGLTINGASGSKTQRQVQLSVSYIPANTTQQGVVWSVVSGNATITNSGLLTYNGSAGNASVVVKATSSKNSSVYAQATVTFALPAIEAPTFSPAQGTYNQEQNVAISCATTGATIYYTTDGSTPTTSSSVYSSPITVSASMTIKAIAVKNGQSSDVATASYNIEIPHTVTVSVSDGSEPVAGATVKLTKNGVDYTPSSSVGGSYIFTVPDGTYTLSVQKVGYDSHTEQVVVNGQDVVVVVVVVEVPNEIDVLATSGALVLPLHRYAFASVYNEAYQTVDGCMFTRLNATNRGSIAAFREQTEHPCTWHPSSTASAEDKALYSLIELNQDYPYIEIRMTNTAYNFATKVSTNDVSYWSDPYNGAWINSASHVLTRQNNPVYLTLQIKPASGYFSETMPTFEDLGLTIKAYRENPNQD